ncbi:hypothetical protein LASUN_13010 [Lentilactobacillus sunkii]|uniref:Uncharacterized protein n=1 Tax=Lentilactobacillus sunkii TaxID=481719 RepID=A0A1E7XCJ8_9LACO|nr:DUF3383 family protein [Lentilactobacillus sunkii]OFA10751.1 hypothetical protein LASUN_13010 [Lentilactobacillus sunkii]
MATAIAPYGRITDVIVNLKVQQPIPQIGFGNILFVTKTPVPDKDGHGGGVPNNATTTDGLLRSITDTKTGAVYKEYSNIDALALDYDSSTPMYAKAAMYFTQDAASDRVAVLSYPDGKLQDSLGAFWFQDWYFMVFDKDDPTDMALASNICEANLLKFLVVQEESVDAFSAWEGNQYTIDCVHPMDEAMDAGFIGSVASKTVGSATWKFKQINGLTTQDFSSTDFTGINNHHAIAYVMVNGTPETSEGWTSNGEYIDSLHGDTWVKTMVQLNVQKDFQQNDKIAYEKSGIDLLTGTVYNTLDTAWQQGIVLTDDATKKGDFHVEASDRNAQSLQDLSKRHYGGIQFWYHRSGAIHSATINGVVQSDTITSNGGGGASS